jgi:hypothetical protein
VLIAAGSDSLLPVSERKPIQDHQAGSLRSLRGARFVLGGGVGRDHAEADSRIGTEKAAGLG